MAYTQLTMSPATIAYARSLGADGLHIGILGALPVVTLVAQFAAAVAVNHMRHRRWFFLSLSIVQRLALLPVALGPLWYPDAPAIFWIWMLLAATGVNHLLMHFCNPLWLSWMGDLLPREGLSRYWGHRQLWMQWSAALSLLLGAMLIVKSGLPVGPAFGLLICLGAVLGVIDILLFLRIEEPPVEQHPQPQLLQVLAGPFRHGQFRTFIAYACFWNFAAMFGAPFISLYLLSYVEMSLFGVLLLWAFSWMGGAVLSRWLGRLVERFGNRPMLVACTSLKSTNMIALLLIPAEPTLAFWILVPVFMVDALLNAGIAIATNGYLLRESPRANRTMFIAAGTALAGMIGGVAAVLAGAMLKWLGDATWSIGGMTLVGFHALFAISLLLRLASIEVARRVQEPDAVPTRRAAMLLLGTTPLRILRYPLGLYREEEPVSSGTGVSPVAEAEPAESAA